MTDPVFKAPLPPEMKVTQTPDGSAVNTQNMTDVPSEASVELAPENNSGQPVWKQNLNNLKDKAIPYFWYVLGGTFFVGLLMGGIFGGSDSEPVQQPRPSKFRSIPNEDIKQPLKPCGVAENKEYCVLYLVNFHSQERKVADFFSLANQMTARPMFEITPENASYANVLIPPGYLMEIKIPPR